MANQPSNAVHVDTPRPGPRRKINIRLHPEFGGRRWGPRAQKFPKAPPPLVDWSSEDQEEAHGKRPVANTSSGQNAESSKSFSNIFGNLQKTESLEEELAINENRTEFSEEALRSHREEDLAGHRSSESDEESSSSKRSREDMEDGFIEEDDTASQLKKSKVDYSSLNVQYSLDENHEAAASTGTGDYKDSATSSEISRSGSIEDVRPSGVSSNRAAAAAGKNQAFVEEGEIVESDVGPDCDGFGDEGRVTDSFKKTGIHRALLKKQVDDKKKSKSLSTGHKTGNIYRQEYADSTEESDEDKETWSKVVESLISEVGELESVQSLSNQLKQNVPSPPAAARPLQDQPVFAHPWGLFPFSPVGPFGPYPSPCWMPPPFFYPYGPHPMSVPPPVHVPPSSNSSSNPEDALIAHQRPSIGSSSSSEGNGTIATPGSYHRSYHHSSNSPKTEEEFQPPSATSASINKGTSPQGITDRHRQSSSESEHSDRDAREQSKSREEEYSTTPGASTSSQRQRKVYIPGKLKQLKEGRCGLSGNLQEDVKEKKEKESGSLVDLMKQDSPASLYSTPPPPLPLPETSLNEKKTPSADSEGDDAKNQDNSLVWRRSWRGYQSMLKAVQSSAPPALSTLKIPKKDESAASYSDSLRGNKQWDSSYSNKVLTNNYLANTPKAQLVARIQPRRRLTLQDEVMMSSIPKPFHQHFGLHSNSLSEKVNSNVVYPWSNVEYIDTHCHIDFLYQRLGCSGSTFEKFGRVRGFPDNYGGCVAIFCTPESFHPTNDVWQNLLKEDKIWAAFGCHPHHVKNYDGNVETHILKGMMHKKAVAFGEIGLDYSNRNASDHVLQHMVFRRQLAMAMQLQKPLVIHSREAESDTLDIMVQMVPRDYKIHRHCFTGPLKMQGITNLVTFPSAVETHHTARELPLDKILLETDAPYFLPRQCPREIRWSHPAMAVFVAEKIARLRNITTDEVLRQVRRNTREMYGI